jgi:hypothetical protein
MSDVKLRRAAVIDLARSWGGPSGVATKPARKTSRGIEELLAWAYRRELPKMQRIAAGSPELMRSGWLRVEQWAEELSLKLDDNRFGVVPDFASDGLPHEDAIRVHEAVCRLDNLDLGMPDDWSPLDDLSDMGGHKAGLPARALDRLCSMDADGARRLRCSPRRLVFKHAILGGCPDWRIDEPEVKLVSEHGRPKWFLREMIWLDGLNGPVAYEVEVDGCDKWRHPKPGAYQKTYLDPDPLDGVVARGEYEIWRSALDMLVEDLRGRLREFEPAPSERPLRPWVEKAPPRGRVLRDLTPRSPVASRKAARRAKVAL